MFEILMILGLFLPGIIFASLIGPITILDSMILLIVIILLVCILGKIDRGGK